MSAKPIELILLRQLARRLPMPAILVDADGVLVYLNPATERMLGYKQADFAESSIDKFSGVGAPRDADGALLTADRMPIAVALHDRRPEQSVLVVHDSDGTPHRIMTTAIPLDGQGGVLLGAMSIFWEDEEAGG